MVERPRLARREHDAGVDVGPNAAGQVTNIASTATLALVTPQRGSLATQSAVLRANDGTDPTGTGPARLPLAPKAKSARRSAGGGRSYWRGLLGLTLRADLSSRRQRQSNRERPCKHDIGGGEE
jgi:hypothetical protein